MKVLLEECVSKSIIVIDDDEERSQTKRHSHGGVAIDVSGGRKPLEVLLNECVEDIVNLT